MSSTAIRPNDAASLMLIRRVRSLATIDQVRLESANMHMIPAGREVAAALARVATGQRVRIDGWLVEVRANDGWRWRSSTTRDDHGPGGCEVVYVCGIAAE